MRAFHSEVVWTLIDYPLFNPFPSWSSFRGGLDKGKNGIFFFIPWLGGHVRSPPCRLLTNQGCKSPSLAVHRHIVVPISGFYCEVPGVICDKSVKKSDRRSSGPHTARTEITPKRLLSRRENITTFVWVWTYRFKMHRNCIWGTR